MTPPFSRLLDPLNLVGIATIGVVAYTMAAVRLPDRGYAWAAIGSFLILSIVLDLLPGRLRGSAISAGVRSAMAVLALVACWYGSHVGTAQILLVVWVAQAGFEWRPRTVLWVSVLLNAGVFLILTARQHPYALLVTLLYACFQAFAALLSTYTRRIEEARDHLARVNADLLATRALLSETSRSNERFRLARDLHDVAGHKLTALRLNLRALAMDAPALPALREAEQLSADVLADIRGVVQTLRAQESLDLVPAIAALAAPFSSPELQTRIDSNVHIADARVAEAIVRCVQEGLTNAAKHGLAKNVHVTLARRVDGLRLEIEDDGKLGPRWQPGNGLLGMRERVEEAGGRVDFTAGEKGGMNIRAHFQA